VSWRWRGFVAAATTLLATAGLAGSVVVGGPGHPPVRAFQPPDSAAEPGAQVPARLLLVTATAGFQHSSNATARDVVERLGRESGAYTTTVLAEVGDLPRLNAETLAQHDALFFANTSGELPLSDAQKAALLEFVAAGGGFAGTHSATDTFYQWTDYGRLVGAYFREHPWTDPVTVAVEAPAHPLTEGLGSSFVIQDEIYTFRENPRPHVRVLLGLDPRSVGTEGDYPLAWCSNYGAGRAFYNALGHLDETWTDPRFQQHLLSALRWTLGRTEADCGTPS
jgi:type 1 glutamine amidotransferase